MIKGTEDWASYLGDDLLSIQFTSNFILSINVKRNHSFFQSHMHLSFNRIVLKGI